MNVTGELLGVPQADRPMFRALVADWSAVLEILSPPAVDRADAAAITIADYFRELLALRRRRPCDDLISALARDDGEQPLHEEDLIRPVASLPALRPPPACSPTAWWPCWSIRRGYASLPVSLG